MSYLATILCTLLLLGACSPSNSEKSPPKLFAEQREALDKAKTVNTEQEKHNEEQQKAVDGQTK
jgi:hypothetical protein